MKHLKRKKTNCNLKKVLHKSYITRSELLINVVMVMMTRWSPVESSTEMSPMWLLEDFENLLEEHHNGKF